MTAIEAYYAAIEEGNLPSVVRIYDDDGHVGLACGTIQIEPGSEAEEMINHPNPQARAIAAIHAIRFSKQQILKSYGEAGIKILS